MDLREYIEICGKAANKKGWKINWETFPLYMALTAHEVLDAVDRGWRNDNKDKAFEEVGDAFVRLFHICYDLEIPIEMILEKILEENKKRPYKHGHKRL